MGALGRERRRGRLQPGGGSVSDPGQPGAGRGAGLDARESLCDNDSGTFFAALGDTLHTGPSGHNLNDLRILLVE